MKKFLRHSRRLFAGMSALAVLLSLAACRAETDSDGDHIAADELARAAVSASGRDPDELERLSDTLDDADIAAYVSSYYGVEESAWTDCAVYRAGGSEAFEIAVLRLRDEAGAKTAAASLEQYIRERQGAFTGYLPAQADIVSRSLAASQGVYAALLICEHPETARDAFYAALNGEEPPQPPAGDLPSQPPSAPTDGVQTQEPSGPTADEMAWALVAAAMMDPDTLECTGDATTLARLMEKTDLSPDVCEDFAMYWTPDWSVDGRALYLYVFKLEDPSQLRYSSSTFTGEARTANREAYINANGAVPFLSNEYRLISGQYAAFVLIDTTTYIVTIHETFYGLLGAEWSGRMEAFGFDPPALDGGQPTETPPSVSAPPTDPVTGRIAYVDPDVYDMAIYDTSAILAAWEGGDPSGLSDYDRDIYDAAAKVLEETLTEGMTDYEKEYALYLWVITHLEYDHDHQDTLAEVVPTSFTPYGGLVNRKGICLGYASTFQLLMDMAGVECITVVGAAENSTEDHAWNQVRLDGEWYCVDPTWDYGYYPVLERLFFFNRTSDFFAGNVPQHQWDYGNVPEAEGTQYAISS